MLRVAFFLALFLAAAFKNDADAIATSEFWSELQMAWYAGLLKQNSNVFLLLVGLSGGALIAKWRKWTLAKNPMATLVIALATFAFLRGVAYDDSAGLRLGQSLVLVVFILGVAEMAASKFSREVLADAITRALFLFSCIFIAVNLGSWAEGYGFAPGVPRLFGTAVHPNFLAIQLMVCNIVLLAFLRGHGRLASLVALLGLLAGIWLLVLTGSRNGLLCFGLGAMAFILARGRFKTSMWLVATGVLTGAAAAAIVLLPSEVLLGFDRGADQDNRTSAWIRMIEAIAEEPFFGNGFDPLASENSYLRSFATYGVFYFSAHIALMVLSTRRLLAALRASNCSHALALFYALQIALLFGGIFEGYLVDAFSLPMLVFLLTATHVPRLLRWRGMYPKLNSPVRLSYAGRGGSLPAAGLRRW